MTNEQAIRRLEDLQRLYLGNEKLTADIEAIGIAIEALKKDEETETITISKGALKVRTGRFVIYDVEFLKRHIDIEAELYGRGKAESKDVLAEIKAEIEKHCCITVGSEDEPAMTLYDVFQIIDKYRTESEEEA